MDRSTPLVGSNVADRLAIAVTSAGRIAPRWSKESRFPAESKQPAGFAVHGRVSGQEGIIAGPVAGPNQIAKPRIGADQVGRLGRRRSAGRSHCR